MQQPQRISAYVPLYNNAATVEMALTSIMRQSLAVDELFVVDDGSTDRSAEIAERMGVRVLRQHANLGRGAARARAMDEARHDLVLCCDATNVLSSNFAANCVHWFEDEKVAAVFGRITQSRARSMADRWRGRHLFKIDEQLTVNRKAKLVTFGTMVRKSAVMAVGNYDHAKRHSEDAELGERLLKTGYDVVLDPSLVLTSIARNTVREVLERYSRWYGPTVRVPWYSYLRLLSYSVKCMAAQDVRERDIFSVPISLLCPHVQFWRAYFSPVKKLHPNRMKSEPSHISIHSVLGERASTPVRGREAAADSTTAELAQPRKGKRICVVNSYLGGREAECERGLYPRHQLWGTDYLARHGYSIDILPSANEDGKWLQRLSRWLTSTTHMRMGNFEQEFQLLGQLRRCDAIYGVTSRDLFLLVWLRSLKLIHAKVIVWVYSPPVKMPPLHRFFRPRVFNNGLDGVLCLTRKTAQAYASFAPRAMVQKIDWGADLQMFQPRGQAGDYFLACGRTQRDYATLLAAAAQVPFKIKLIVPRDIFENRPIPPNVEIIGGPLSPADDRGVSYPELIERHLANCRAVLIPLSEDQNTTAGFTNAIEALAVGKPVLMTRTGCLDLDIAGAGCGFYVNPGDVDGWARAMRILALDSDLAQEMGRRGRMQAEKHYNTDRFGRDLCNFFDQLCASR